MSKTVKKVNGIKSSKTRSGGAKIKRKAGKRTSKKNDKSDIVIQYVVPIGNGWVIQNSKRKKFTFISDSKREAVYMARSIAKRKGQIVEIRTKDRKVVRENYTRRR
jgi:hypothetical protein